MDISNWNKQQYHAFVLFCGAYSNFEVSESEELYITSMVGEENFNFAKNTFNDLSDFECINLIRDGKKQFYPGEHDKQLLESELKTLFAADHEYAILEDNFLRYLDKVL